MFLIISPWRTTRDFGEGVENVYKKKYSHIWTDARQVIRKRCEMDSNIYELKQRNWGLHVVYFLTKVLVLVKNLHRLIGLLALLPLVLYTAQGILFDTA